MKEIKITETCLKVAELSAALMLSVCAQGLIRQFEDSRSDRADTEGCWKTCGMVAAAAYQIFNDAWHDESRVWHADVALMARCMSQHFFIDTFEDAKIFASSMIDPQIESYYDGSR